MPVLQFFELFLWEISLFRFENHPSPGTELVELSVILETKSIPNYLRLIAL